MSHLISIVGAGPGDPDLLTVKALRCIQQADCILHDALVSREVLAVSSPDAEHIYVGKLYQDGQDQAKRQDEINTKILDLAAQGKRVVRLKSGDPMIFGRGAEEILFCLENKLNYEVIPGVTSALAAAAEFGIPMTQRGINSMTLFGTGHYQEGEFPDLPSFVSVLNSGSPVFLFMGLNKLIELAKTLITNGVDQTTCVQILSKVSQKGQQALETNLANVGSFLKSNRPAMPALIVIGKNAKKLRRAANV